MKTKEEILKTFGITKDSKHHSYEYLYSSVIKAMEKYRYQQKPFTPYTDTTVLDSGAYMIKTSKGRRLSAIHHKGTWSAHLEAILDEELVIEYLDK